MTGFRSRAAFFAAMLAVTTAPVCGPAKAQDQIAHSQWRLKFLAISCRSAPCSDWTVQDRKTGVWFPAVVKFARPADERHIHIGGNDLLADGERSELELSGRRYTLILVSRVVGEAPPLPAPQ